MYAKYFICSVNFRCYLGKGGFVEIFSFSDNYVYTAIVDLCNRMAYILITKAGKYIFDKSSANGSALRVYIYGNRF